MSIELHCTSCSKLIKAPDDAGGKRGKCPYCKQSVYVPLPADESDVIGLAPVDDDDERRAEVLRREALGYAASLSRDVKSGKSTPPPPAGDKTRPAPAEQELVDIPKTVEAFVLAMRDSKLEVAERLAATLKRAGTRARDHVEGRLLDAMAPPIGDLPPPLMKGFLKKLLAQLE